MLYKVGPDEALKNIHDVPWYKIGRAEDGTPDTVEIVARPNGEPYKEMVAVMNTGTVEKPITVRGISDSFGRRPIIDADGLRLPPTKFQNQPGSDYNIYNHDRGVFRVGGSSQPSDQHVRYLTFENFHIRNNRKSYLNFQGAPLPFEANAAGIQVEDGSNIAFRKLILENLHCGLFVGNGYTRANRSRNILIQECDFWAVSNPASGLEHAIYTEGLGVIIEFCRFRGVPEGGNGHKSRDSDVIFRYNWIENFNYLCDYVSSLQKIEDRKELGREPFTRVYGNVFFKDNAGQVAIIHTGFDSQGHTFEHTQNDIAFYHNTIIGGHPSHNMLFSCTGRNVKLRAYNNLFYIPNLISTGGWQDHGPDGAFPYYGATLAGNNKYWPDDGGTIEAKGNIFPLGNQKQHSYCWRWHERWDDTYSKYDPEALRRDNVWFDWVREASPEAQKLWVKNVPGGPFKTTPTKPYDDEIVRSWPTAPDPNGINGVRAISFDEWMANWATVLNDLSKWKPYGIQSVGSFAITDPDRLRVAVPLPDDWPKPMFQAPARVAGKTAARSAWSLAGAFEPAAGDPPPVEPPPVLPPPPPPPVVQPPPPPVEPKPQEEKDPMNELLTTLKALASDRVKADAAFETASQAHQAELARIEAAKVAALKSLNDALAEVGLTTAPK